MYETLGLALVKHAARVSPAALPAPLLCLGPMLGAAEDKTVAGTWLSMQPLLGWQGGLP